MRKLFNTPFRAIVSAVITLSLMAGIVKAADNYAATAGSGLTFAAKLISAVLYPQFLVCDPTSGATKCAPVDATTGIAVNVTACASGVCGVARTTAITNVSPIAGEVHTSAPAYTNLDSQPPSMTVRGGYWVNMDTWAGTALGAPANFGTSPGAVVAGSSNASVFQGTTAVVAEPCQTATPSYQPINISSATTTRIVTENTKKVYICHIHLIASAAENVAIIEGTGSSCAGGTPAGMAGGLTAASGWNITGNGLSLGNGVAAVLATANAAYSVCLVTSNTSQLSGVVKYVQP